MIFIHIRLRCALPPITWFLDRCSSVVPEFFRFPTFTRPAAKPSVPEFVAGQDSCSDEAWTRYILKSYRYQPYQYENLVMVRDPSGAFRLPTVAEKERMLGFFPGHVSKMHSAFELKNFGTRCYDEQHDALGNSFSCIVVARILSCFSSRLSFTDCDTLWQCWHSQTNILGRQVNQIFTNNEAPVTITKSTPQGSIEPQVYYTPGIYATT